jgi:hypothetical protein
LGFFLENRHHLATLICSWERKQSVSEIRVIWKDCRK